MIENILQLHYLHAIYNLIMKDKNIIVDLNTPEISDNQQEAFVTVYMCRCYFVSSKNERAGTIGAQNVFIVSIRCRFFSIYEFSIKSNPQN